jgi:hypothetical protein
MKKLLKKIEDIYAAAAYAEAGEFETAREILNKETQIQKKDRVTRRPRRRLRAPGIPR